MSEARDKLRAASLGAPAKKKHVMVPWNGHEYEVRTPSLKDQRIIDEASMVGRGKGAKRDGIKALVLALIRCVYVPGTDELVFEAADVEAMESRTTDDFVGVFANAIGKLSSDASEAEVVEKN